MATIKDLAVRLTADIEPFQDSMAKAQTTIDDFEKAQVKSGKVQIASTKEVATKRKKILNELSEEGKKLSQKEIKEKKELATLLTKQSKTAGAEQTKIKKQVLDKELQLTKTQQAKEEQILKDKLKGIKDNEEQEIKIKQQFGQKDIQLSKKIVQNKLKDEVETGKQITAAKKAFVAEQKKQLSELSAEGKRLSQKEIKEKKQLSDLLTKQSRATGAEQVKIKKQALDKELQLTKTQQKKERQIMNDRLSVVKGNENQEFKVKQQFAQKEIALSKKVATQQAKIEREAGKTSIKAARNKLQQNMEIAENAATALGSMLKGQVTPMAALVGGPFGAAIGIGIDLLSELGGAAIEAGEKFIDFNNTINNIASVVEIQSNIKLTTQEIDNLKVQILAIQTPIGVTSQDMASLSQTVASFEPPDKIIETTEAITDLFRIGKGKTGLENITSGVSKVADSLNITGKEAADLTAVLSQEFKGKAVDPLGEALTELGTITSKANLAIKDGAKAGRESIEVFSQLVKSGTEVAESTTGTEEIFLALNDIMTNPELKKAMTKDLPEGMTLLDTGLQKGSVSATKFIDFMQRGGEATKQLATLLPSTAGEAIQQLQVQFDRTGKSINDFRVSQDSIANASKKLGLAFTNLKEQQMEKLEDRAESMTLTFGKHMADGIESGRDALLGMADAMASADFSGFLRDIPVVGGLFEGLIDLFVDSAVEAEKAFQNFMAISDVSEGFQDFTSQLTELEGADFLGEITNSMDMLNATAPEAAQEIQRIQESINLTDVQKVERIGSVLSQISDVKAFEVFEAMNDAISASEEAAQDLMDDFEFIGGVQIELNKVIGEQRDTVDELTASYNAAKAAGNTEEARELAREITEEQKTLNEWITKSNNLESESLKQTQNRLEMSRKSGDIAKGNKTEAEELALILASQAEQLQQQPDILANIIEKSGQQIGLSLVEIDNLKIQNGLQVSILDQMRHQAESVLVVKDETEEVVAENEKLVEVHEAINDTLDKELDAIIQAGETEAERLAREKEILEIKKAELELSLASVESDEQRVKLAKAITSIDRQIAKLDKPDKKTEKKKEKKKDKEEKKREKVADRGIKVREAENAKIEKAAEAREKAEKDHAKKIKQAADNINKASVDIVTSSATAIEDIVKNRFQPSLNELLEAIGADTTQLDNFDNTVKTNIVTLEESNTAERARLDKVWDTANSEKKALQVRLDAYKPLLNRFNALLDFERQKKDSQFQGPQDKIKSLTSNISVNLGGLDKELRDIYQVQFQRISNIFLRGEKLSSQGMTEANKLIADYTSELGKAETKLREENDAREALSQGIKDQAAIMSGAVSDKADVGGVGIIKSEAAKGRETVGSIAALEQAAESYKLIAQYQDEINQLQDEMLSASPEQMTELQIDVTAKMKQTTAALISLNEKYAENVTSMDKSDAKALELVDGVNKMKQAALNAGQQIKGFADITGKHFVDTIANNTESVKQFSDFVGGNFEKMNEKQFLFSKQKLENEIETNKLILDETKKALSARQVILEADLDNFQKLGDTKNIVKTEKALRNVGSELGNIKSTFEELETVKPDLLSKEAMKNAGEAFMKVGSIVSGATDSILGFADSMQNAQSSEEKIEAGADLAKTVGSALMKSKVPQIALIGAFIVGAAMITKAILKIKEAVSGHEETDLDRAEDRATKEDNLRSIQQARIGIMEKLVSLGDRNLDQSKEQLETERAINQLRKDSSVEFSKFSEMSAQELANAIELEETNKQRFENNISGAEKALELDMEGRQAFVSSMGVEVKVGTSTKQQINDIIAKQNALLIDSTTNIGLANDALDFQQTEVDLLKQVTEEEIQVLQFKNTLLGESLAILNEIESQRKTVLNDMLTEVDLTGKTNDEIKEILANTEDMSPPIMEAAQAWLTSVDAVDQYNANLKTANDLLDKQKTLLGLNRDLGNITADEYKKGMLDILEQQLQIRVDEYDQLLLQENVQAQLLDNEIDRLGIELEIKNLMEEQGDAADKVLINLIRQHQQRLKQVRAGTADPAQAAKLRDDMVVRLRETGKSEEFIQDFLDSLPKFEKGGFVNTTGPALLHENELVLPADFVKKLEGIQKSPFNFEPEKSPLNLYNTPEAKVFSQKMMGAGDTNSNITINVQFDQNNNISGGDAVQIASQLSGISEADLINAVQKGIESGKIQLKR